MDLSFFIGDCSAEGTQHSEKRPTAATCKLGWYRNDLNGCASTTQHTAHNTKLATCKITAALHRRRVRAHTQTKTHIGYYGNVVTHATKNNLGEMWGTAVGDSVVLVQRPGGLLWHLVETAHFDIIRCVP